MDMFLIGLIWIINITIGSTDSCGICVCDGERKRIVCAGLGFTSPPDLPKEALINAQGLGLQRNFISYIPNTYFDRFRQLAVVDVRNQKTTTGCVQLDPGRSRFILIIGKSLHIIAYHLFIYFPFKTFQVHPRTMFLARTCKIVISNSSHTFQLLQFLSK